MVKDWALTEALQPVKKVYNILIEKGVQAYNRLLPTDTSQYRLHFGLSLLYTDRVPFELLDSAALL
jgi:hypothetical protein